jgi:hypothetical protein
VSLDDVTGPRAIYQQWIAVWPTLTATPYVFDDQLAEESTSFARVSVQMLDTGQHSMGDHPKWENAGLIWVKLVGPAGTGRKEQDTLVTHVRAVFQGRRLAPTDGEPGVVCLGTSQDRTMIDGAKRIVTTKTPFYYLERR